MSTGVPLTRAPRIKAKRDRHVSVITVACQSCQAPPGSACVRLDGQPSAGHLQHPSRRRMAVRADNLARGI